MEAITVFENECATLVYYPAVKIVQNTFRGRLTSAQFREVMNVGVEVMATYGVSKWLSDDRENMMEFTAEDQAWSDNDWYPRMAKIGWKTWAIVYPNVAPDQVKARSEMIDIVDKNYDRGIWIAVFSNLDEALQWLINVG